MSDLRFGFVVPHSLDFRITPAWASYEKVMHIWPDHVVCKSADIGNNRNGCVNEHKSQEKKQIGFSFDRILFVDSDVEFTESDVRAILSHPQPIVSGAYQRKVEPSTIHVGWWGNVPGRSVEFAKWDRSGCETVDHVGMGFCAISRGVFETMEYPWFEGLHLEWGIYAAETSEDYGFCVKAQRAGYTIIVDHDIRLKHVDWGIKMEAKQDQGQGISYDSVEVQYGRLQAAGGDIVRRLLDELRQRDTINNQLRAELHKLSVHAPATAPETPSARI